MQCINGLVYSGIWCPNLYSVAGRVVVSPSQHTIQWLTWEYAAPDCPMQCINGQIWCPNLYSVAGRVLDKAVSPSQHTIQWLTWEYCPMQCINRLARF